MEYVHPPLPSGDHIRLLHVHFDKPTRVPVLSFQTVSLNGIVPQYTAISYAWEDSTPFSFVDVEGGWHRWVSRTISKLIDSFEDHDRTLWIDALCINQSDDTERAHQVDLMGKVYSRAQQVLIWLGEGNEETDVAFALLNSELDYHPRSDVRAKVLMEVLKRPWFQRAWVIQEATLAKEVWICCGRKKASFDIFLSAVKMLWNSKAAMRYLHIRYVSYFGLRCATRISILRQTYQAKANIPLESLLEAVFPFAASDPRDFIFAIRGLTDKADWLPSADYSCSAENIFARATVEILEQSSSLDILALAGTGPKTLAAQLLEIGNEAPIQINERLPSWVLDPRMNGYDEPFGECIAGKWNAGGALTEPPVISDTKELHVVGKVVDAVASKGPLIATWGINVLRQCLNRSLKLAESVAASEEGGPPYKEVWQSLVMDLDINEKPVCPELSIAFEDLRNSLNPGVRLEDVESNLYFRTLRKRSGGWRTFVTEQGRFGLSWLSIREGDAICLVSGCRFPLIIRFDATDNCSSSEGHKSLRGTLIGWAYVRGLMHAEGLSKSSDTKNIVLV